jgi:transcriptional regulator with XRE-family HTH domain
MEVFKHTVGQRIRAAREYRNLTQGDLARRLGCAYQIVQRCERGEKLSLDRILSIANALDVDPVFLLLGHFSILDSSRMTFDGLKPMTAASNRNSTTSMRRRPASMRATQV